MKSTDSVPTAGQNVKKIFFGVLFLVLVILSGLFISSQSAKDPASINFPFPNQVSVGQSVTIPLKISTSVSMNAAEFYFSFPADLVEITSISTNDSFFQLWITNEPRFDNSLGLLSAAGGLPKPGFVGKNGLVATVSFKFKAIGSGKITLDQSKSRILANDGLGSKINAQFDDISFTIK